MSRITIIADDVTGACDSGVKLLSGRRTVDVFMDSDHMRLEDVTAEVVAISTNTRAMAPHEAAEKLRSLLSRYPKETLGSVYKKVDSMLRGNLGKELETLLEQLGCHAAILAPTLPENGRRMKDGLIYADFSDGSQSIFSAVDRVKATTALPLGTIDLSVVRAGVETLAGVIDANICSGKKIILVDAETWADLAFIADATRTMAVPPLLAGSAGLARCAYSTQDQQALAQQKQGMPCTSVLAVVGSVSPSTVGQVQALKVLPSARFFVLDTRKLHHAEGAEMMDELTAALQNLKGPIQVLTSQSVMQNAPISISENVSSPDITRAFVDLAISAMENPRITGLLLSGGDIAEGFFSRIGVNKITLEGEPLPGLVAAQFPWDSKRTIRVVTKSGSFGDAGALVSIVEYLLQV